MRIFFFCLLSIPLLQCSTRQNTQATTIVENDDHKTQVTFNFLIKEPWCNGVRPTDEQHANAVKPKPYREKKIYITKTNFEVVDTLLTDINGQSSSKLAPGDYYLVDSKKIESDQTKATFSKTSANIDLKCFEKWINTPDKEFFVADTAQSISHTVKGRCAFQGKIPCLKNLPPPRPSAPPRD